MKRIVLCVIAALMLVAGCGVPGGGNKSLAGKVQHYHTKGKDLLFVIFTDVPTGTNPMDSYMEHLPSGGSSWKGRIRAEGYHPIEYRSDSQTLELCEDTYSLSDGRVFLVAADENAPEPKVTQIKLDAPQTAAFESQWKVSKERGLEELASSQQVREFLHPEASGEVNDDRSVDANDH